MPAVVILAAPADRLVAAGFPHPPAIAAAGAVPAFRRAVVPAAPRRAVAGVVVGFRRAVVSVGARRVVAAGDDDRVRRICEDLRARTPIGGGEAAPALALSAALRGRLLVAAVQTSVGVW